MLIDLCPDRQQLRDFVTGRLPGYSLDAIAEHLETCDECDANVATLDKESDSFINELKFPVGDESFINELEFHEAMSVVQAYESDAPQPPKRSSRNQQVGQYMLVERLGTGGMGTVYKALHTKLEKFVAIKILRTKRMLDDRAIARFEREMKAVGKLKHENIVQASDAGDADGKQYLVMEYIDGAVFSELIARNERLSIADACELVRQAAVGLQHAHEHGLVHRDMKPSNLMLAEGGSVKILDLGLAGFAGEQFTSASECNTHAECDDLTFDGQIMGTAEYIAPEQAENSHDVDIRADIYGLGCTLYSLLVGVPPFQRQEFATPKQLINAHQTFDRPSIANLPPQLARVIDRMLAIDPSDRFSTPAEVADALSPFTINADVSALLSPKPKSTNETDAREDFNPVDGRLWKAILQRKALVALAILAVIAFAAFGIVFNLKTPYGTVEIETEDEDVEISVSRAGKEIEIINATSGWDIRLKEGKYDLSLKSGDDKLKLSNNTVTVSRDDKIVLRVTLKNTAVAVRGDPHDKPEAQTRAIHRLRKIGVEITEKNGVATGFAFGSSAEITDADLAALESLDTLENFTLIGCVNVTDAGFAHLKNLRRLQQLNLSPSNITDEGLANVKGMKDLWMLGLNSTRVTDAGLQHLIDNRNITVLYLNNTKITDEGLAFLEQMKDMYWMDLGGTAVTDVGLAHLGHMSKMKLLSVDGTRVTDAGLKRLDRFPKLELINLNRTAVTDAGIAHLAKLRSIQRLLLSDTQITSASLDHLAKLKNLRELQLLNSRIPSACIEELRKRLPKDCEIKHSFAPAQQTQPIEVLTPTTLPGHENHVNSVVFSPDGKTLAAGDSAGTVILWDLPTQRKLRSMNNVQVIECVDFAPDGKTLVTADRGHAITFWDVETGQKIKKLKEHTSAIMSVAYSPEGEMLASAGVDNAVKLWDSASGEVRATLSGHKNAIQEVVFSPDGRKLASVDLDGILKIWDPVAGELLSTYKVDRSGMGLSFSPDGKTLATANYPPRIQLFDVATGRVLRTLMGHRSRVRDVAFSPDGRVLASAGDDQTVRFWDVASGRQIGVFSGHTGRVHDVEFSPDGKSLASGSADKTSKVWNVERFTSGKIERRRK